MENFDKLYFGKPWDLERLEGDRTLEGVPLTDLLDPHPDYLWYDESGEAYSIGTSLFVGPQVPRLVFGSDKPMYCPESVKWNRVLYYAMDDPRLFDPLPSCMKERIKVSLAPLKQVRGSMHSLLSVNEEGPYQVTLYGDVKSLEGVPGVWSLWGKCGPNGSLRCLDVHECVNLAYEMRTHHSMLEEAKKYDWNDDYFYRTTQDRDGTVMFGKFYEPGTVFSMERRSKAISNWYDLEIRVVALGLSGSPGDKFLRELVEAQFAWEWKAAYWNRSYFQAVTQRMVVDQLQVENVMKRK